MSQEKIEIPDCAGYWIAGITCDGGVNKHTNEKEPPCSFKKKCKLLQQYFIKTHSDPITFKNQSGDFHELLTKIEIGEKPKKPKRPRPKKEDWKVRERKRLRERKKRYAPYRKMVLEFCEVLKEVVPKHGLAYKEKRAGCVNLGDIYLQELKHKNSREYRIGCRITKKRCRVLFEMVMAPYNDGLDIKLLLPEKPENMPENLRFTSWKQPPFVSGLKTIKREHFEFLAEIAVITANMLLFPGTEKRETYIKKFWDNLPPAQRKNRRGVDKANE